jgi:hypothetical protein
MRKLITLILIVGSLPILYSFPVDAGNAFNLREKPSGREHQIKSMIGVLKDLGVRNGCGCEFGYRNNSPDFVLITDDLQNKGWMNIDGRDVELKQLSSSSTDQKDFKIGSRFTIMYEADEIKVMVAFTIIGFCPPRDPECATIRYKAIIAVRKGNRKQNVKVKGRCGCP